MISKQDILGRASSVLAGVRRAAAKLWNEKQRVVKRGRLTRPPCGVIVVNPKVIPMKRISFTFDEEKFVQTLALLASKNLPELTTLKVAKLLFLADKKHFTTYGRPIVGDRYVGMKNGPCPSAALRVMNGAVKEASQTQLCAYLSVALLVGLGANALLGWWWADPLTALVIAAVAAKEGRESWRGEDCADGCC